MSVAVVFGAAVGCLCVTFSKGRFFYRSHHFFGASDWSAALLDVHKYQQP